MTEFKDHYGNPLRDGLYFAGDGFDGDIYFIQLSATQETFTAESHEGLIPIDDHNSLAGQLIPLANPRSNLEFALLKLD